MKGCVFVAANYPYEKTIHNKYLNDSKLIKAKTLSEFEIKEQKIRKRWKSQEELKRAKETIANMKLKAELQNREAENRIKEYNNILANSLDIDPKIHWDSLLDFRSYSEFSYNIDEPSLETISLELGVPHKSFAEYIFPWLENKRINLEKNARKKYEDELNHYNDQRQKAYNKYLSLKQKFEAKQNNYNNNIIQWRTNFELGIPEAVENYIAMVLSNSHYPKEFTKEFETQFILESKTVIISCFLPNTEDIPNISGYKYIATSKQIKPIELAKKSFQSFYENIIFQITLKTINEVLKSIYTNYVDNIVFNGWIRGIDKATGNDFTSCILSVSTLRNEFENINLQRVDPKACIRQLKGLMAGPLYHLAPIKPILDINRKDKRFVESKDILSKINFIPNLASMHWEDFEHLIKQLFEKILAKEGCEVKVTQPSRDGGIDVIAFDPNPITGGKFIIQAKRYNNVVPVSAARDLYGTLVREGATKGILVTTSDFGSETLSFVKDVPITLINGSNLVYLFQEYGYNVRIVLKESS